MVLPNNTEIPIPVINNCPYANQKVLRVVKELRKGDDKERKVRNDFSNFYGALKLKFKSQAELDQHRREGHVSYSPHCPECKNGTVKQRPHHRQTLRQGGELSIDVAGPYSLGMPVTDRAVVKTRWPRYMLVGAFVPFKEKEVLEQYEQEVRDMRAAGLAGPVPMELSTKPNGQTMYFVEMLSEKSEAARAGITMINRIQNLFKRKAVYRVHADRAQELTGERAREAFERIGVTVTSTAGYESNANGRAERAVLFFQEKVRTLLSTNIRSERFQKQLASFWTFAAQHSGEVRRREQMGEPRSKYEFGQTVLSKVKEPLTKFHPRLQKVTFLGFAPNVTNGYFVMRADGKLNYPQTCTRKRSLENQQNLIRSRPVMPLITIFLRKKWMLLWVQKERCRGTASR